MSCLSNLKEMFEQVEHLSNLIVVAVVALTRCRRMLMQLTLSNKIGIEDIKMKRRVPDDVVFWLIPVGMIICGILMYH